MFTCGVPFPLPILNPFFQPEFKAMSFRAAPPDGDHGCGSVVVVVAVSMVGSGGSDYGYSHGHGNCRAGRGRGQS
jgi:hypothetical protein